jgi:diguanylate cyclase (GGDEF)-like protein
MKNTIDPGSQGGEVNQVRLELLKDYVDSMMTGVQGKNHAFLRNVLSQLCLAIENASRYYEGILSNKPYGDYLKGKVDQIALMSIKSVLLQILSLEVDSEEERGLVQEAGASPALNMRYLEAWKVAATNEFKYSIQRAELEYVLQHGGMDDKMIGYLNVGNNFGKNRFKELSADMVRRAEREGQPISVLFADIDDFKRFNDVFGHAAGDLALSHYAQIFHEQLRRREGDTIFVRQGGEEIVVYLYGFNANHAASVAENARRALDDSRLYILSPDVVGEGEQQPVQITPERACQLGIANGGDYEEIHFDNPRTGEKVIAGRKMVINDPRHPDQRVIIHALDLQASIGVAQLGFRPKDMEIEAYVSEGKGQADQQEAIAKQSGKNCVVVNGKKWQTES